MPKSRSQAGWIVLIIVGTVVFLGAVVAGLVVTGLKED
jgi:hypothetical protein